LIILFLFLLIIWYGIYKYLKLQENKYIEGEIAVIIHLIDETVRRYKLAFFQKNYEILLKKYDIDDNSPTKATARFQTEYSNLLHTSTQEIISSYMSNQMKKKAFKYFSFDSLLLHIISSLRG
jgi:hypothetical protein